MNKILTLTNFSGNETCLCCIEVECQSRSQAVNSGSDVSLGSQLLPQHKGLSKLEGMLHKLVLSSGIKHSLAPEFPKSFVQSPNTKREHFKMLVSRTTFYGAWVLFGSLQINI